MSRRIRRTPFTDKVQEHGASGFTVVNHMLLPKAFERTVEDDFVHLREHVQLWDVSCQRQVEVSGPDAAKLVQWMTPRDLRNAQIGQCLYVPLVDECGGMINDPVLLKLSEDRFWLSIADSDVLLWAKGLALGARMNVHIEEPDVSPLAIQGPKAAELLAGLFGEHIRKLKFFRFGYIEFEGTRQVIARTGYSMPGGFEIFMQGSQFGPALWDTIWNAGQPYSISPGCPNVPDRIEAGLLSLGNEFTRENNPFEIGLGKYCSLETPIDFIGREALRKIARDGVKQEIRGIVFDGGKCPPCSIPWPVTATDGRQVGQVTSAGWSPRLKKNVGLSMIARGYWDDGSTVSVKTSDGQLRRGTVTSLPFK
jgi:dimethylsulfoniopropionate demethylase